MKHRELINLPSGKYNLTDGIWDYTLTKQLTEQGKSMYSIKELITGDTLTLFEYLEKEEGIIYTKLSSCVNIGGIFIHSKDLSFALTRLKFKPRSSYKQTFCTNVPSQLNSLTI